MERIEEFIFWATTSIASAVSAGVLWLIRRVLTNQRQIALLEAEMATRAKLREEDRERMANIERQGAQILGVLLKEVSDDHEG